MVVLMLMLMHVHVHLHVLQLMHMLLHMHMLMRFHMCSMRVHTHDDACVHVEAGRCFTLARPDDRFVSLRDIFVATEGVFTIHCTHYHAEDIELHGTGQVEGIEHYVVYNADTR